MSQYSDQYRHPNWQKKRLEVLNEKGFSCELCGDDHELLHVHHKRYLKDKKIWEYTNSDFIVACHSCHDDIHVELSEIRDMLGFVHPECYSTISQLLRLFQFLNPYEVNCSVAISYEKAMKFISDDNQPVKENEH